MLELHLDKNLSRTNYLLNISFNSVFNDILHMSVLAGTHVFKAFPAYTTTEL